MEENEQIGGDSSIRTYVESIFRHKILVILTFLIGVTGTYSFLLLRTPIYEASVKMLIKGLNTVQTTFYRGIGERQLHFTQMAIVTSEPVLSRASRALKLHKRPVDYEKKFCHPLKKYLIDYRLKTFKEKLEKLKTSERRKFLFERTVDYLKTRVRTELLPGTNIFVITVSDYDPDMAISIANVISRSYAIFDQQQQLSELLQRYGQMHPVVQQLSDNIYSMTRNLSGKRLPDIEAIGTASVKIIEQASASGPIGRSKNQLFLISLFACLFAGIGLAIGLDFIDKKFKSPNEILKFLDLPTIGSIPKRRFIDKKLLNDTKSRSRYTQFYKDLFDQLFVFMKVQQLKSILIISAVEDSDNSQIMANIGLGFSNSLDRKTLIINANLR